MRFYCLVPPFKATGVNKRFVGRKGGRGLALSSGYRATKEHFRIAFIEAKPPGWEPISGGATMQVFIRTYKDWDALMKPLGDALEEAGIVTDDANILDARVKKTPGKRGHPEEIEVMVWAN